MAVDIEVIGRLSKLKDLDIEYLGKRIPYTYSHNKINNSPGYNWWVSKHFAIKSDLPEHKVKLYLELLELSYPHYVSLFGAEPANIENQRIAVVYGASRESTKSTMLDDGFTRGVHKHAGGETMYYNRAGYSFPSHREQHQRYIVIHETMHAYHMALTGHSTWAPNWITEGLADSIASHVYYPERKELAVMVFDRAPMNYIASGLKQYVKGNKPSIEAINNDPALKRGLNFFIVHFLLSDPERAYYFSLFRDRLMAANPHSSDTLPTASRLLKETFPNWQKLEQEFAEFVSGIQASFMIASGPWEQNGDKYWIRSYKEPLPARLDIRPNNNKLSFDFPQPEPSVLVEQTGNFVAGALIDFTPEHIKRGSIGLALGVEYSADNQDYLANYEGEYKAESDSYLSVTIEQGRKLTLAANNLDFAKHSYPLSQDMVEAIKQELKLGVATSIKQNKLIITLKTNGQQQAVSIPLTTKLQNSIETGKLALLANNNKHQLTPYFNGQPPKSDYFTQPDAKQWTSNTQLYRLFKTCVEFNLNCPEQLSQSISKLALEPKQAEQIAQLEKQIIAITKDNDEALLSLSGLAFHLVHNNDGLRQEVDVPATTSANINSEFTWLQGEQKLETFTQLKRMSAGSQQQIIRDNNKADKLAVKNTIEWQGQRFVVEHKTDKQAFDGVYLTPNIKFDNDTLTVSALLTGPYSGETEGTIKFELLPNESSVKLSEQAVKLSPYQAKTWQHSFTLAKGDTQQAIEITADLVVDGEGVLLSEMIYLNN